MTTTWRRIAAAAAALLLTTAVAAGAAAPPAPDVTDFGRTRWRTHFAPEEPQYPAGPGIGPEWEVPLGLSRSQPLVVRRDYDGDGRVETRIFHLGGDTLWAINGDMTPPARRSDQTVDAYRAALTELGFLLWKRPASTLCDPGGQARQKDELLDRKCALLGPTPHARPFASSHAAYWKGATPAEDVVYAGFGHPASVVAIRAATGEILGGYIIDARGDRGIVGAPLVFPGDRVVVNTTTGHGYILTGLASREHGAAVRGLAVGGRMSFSPVPLGDSGFILAADGRYTPELDYHGYMMAYSLAGEKQREFTPLWPAAVVTPAGIPGEAAVDGGMLYTADKYGRLYALRHQSGELLWCRQYQNRSLVPCQNGGPAQPGFVNMGPGVDEDRVYFVFRNREGPARGGGLVVALNKATGQVLWQQPMEAWGNTAPVPMG